MASQIGSLDGSLSSKISLSTRQTIIESIFDLRLTAKDFHFKYNAFEAYFSDWFGEKCEGAENEVGVRKLQEVVDLIVHLRSATNERKCIIKERFRQSTSTTSTTSYSENNDEENLLEASLNLAASLYLIISISSLQNSLTPGRIIEWEDDWTLANKVHTTLWPPPQLSEQVKLPKSFTAVNLEKIAGIKILWTSNLADHLSLTCDDTKLILFHQVSFLELHKSSKRFLPLLSCQRFSETVADALNSAIFDPNLIDETARTLGLLIPSTDPRSREWFNRKQKELCLDSLAGSYGPLKASERQIDNFHYWKDRLIMLKQTFDDTEPESLSLFWYDDRKKVQWYNFWGTALILFLTLTFGSIQIIEGGVQAWAAVQSMPSSKQAFNDFG